MADRIDDLRGWWDRTRRRKLKPGVQTVVERVVPRGAGAHVATPSVTPIVSSAVPQEEVLHGSVPEGSVTPEPVDTDETLAGEALLAAVGVADAEEPEVAVEPSEAEIPSQDPLEDVPLEVEDEALTGAGDGSAVGGDGTADDAAPVADWWQTDAGTQEPAVVEAAGSDEVAVPVIADASGEAIAPEAPAPTVEDAATALTWAAPGTAPWELPAPEVDVAPEVGHSADMSPEPIAEAADSWATPSTALPAAGEAVDAADPWSGITWSAAEEAAPWSATIPTQEPEPVVETAAALPTPDVAADDPLDLDDDQRRWLGRSVEAVEGIGPGYGAQLEAIGVATLRELLLRGATRRGRQEIADDTGISGKLILRWVNNADLFRIRGVGTQYADLLEAAGVDTVVELALRRPENLVARLQTTNEIRSLVRQVPSEAQVADWVTQAKELPRIVAY